MSEDTEMDQYVQMEQKYAADVESMTVAEPSVADRIHLEKQAAERERQSEEAAAARRQLEVGIYFHR